MEFFEFSHFLCYDVLMFGFVLILVLFIILVFAHIPLFSFWRQNVKDINGT